jgi:thymidine kinase
MCGHLELIIGPMFSGKSTEIIRKIRLLKKIDKKILVIKPLIDNRYDADKITSHNYESVDCIVVSNLFDIDDSLIQSHDTIVIDEGQFFSDLVTTVDSWINNYKVNIIVAGLDGDFQRKPIGQILNLIPQANSCIKLNSLCNICKDGTEAPFSYRIDCSKESVLVGGADKYMPLCRNHYNQLSNYSQLEKNVQNYNL